MPSESGSSTDPSSTEESVGERAVGEASADVLPAGVATRVGRLVHDLRNPLNTISMNVELLAMVANEEAGAEIGEGLDALGRAVDDLERCLGDLDGYVRTLHGA